MYFKHYKKHGRCVLVIVIYSLYQWLEGCLRWHSSNAQSHDECFPQQGCLIQPDTAGVCILCLPVNEGYVWASGKCSSHFTVLCFTAAKKKRCFVLRSYCLKPSNVYDNVKTLKTQQHREVIDTGTSPLHCSRDQRHWLYPSVVFNAVANLCG